ncbi:MAG: hypothetical protein HQM16_02155 [Deltaproteobacteria bacterium]|nr:hypothetical protein [Deltaproteobacteria bacterium]
MAGIAPFLSPTFPQPANPSLFRVRGAPYSMSAATQVTVGNPVILKELGRLIAGHGTSQAAIRTLTPWDAVKMPVNTVMLGGLQQQGETTAGVLMIRSFQIYAEPDAKVTDHKTISFLIKVPGQNGDKEGDIPSPDMIKQGAVIAVAQHLGECHPFTDFAVTATDGQHAVHYRAYDPATGQYVDKTLDTGMSEPADTVEKQYLKDRQLFDALFEIQGYVLNSLGYFAILQGAEFSKGNASVEQAGKTATEVVHLLSAPLMRLVDRFDAIMKDEALKAYYSQRDPDLIPFMKAMTIYAKKELLLKKEDANTITELATASEKLMTGALEKFKWKGKQLTRAEFYQTLRELNDPKDRRELLETYSGAVLKAHQNGLFPMIDRLNALAQKYGYTNFAAYKGDVMHGITPEQFDKQCREYHEANSAALEAFIKELTRLNGGKTVYEWDVHHLADQLAKEKLSGGEIPKIRFSDALDAAKMFFKDLGIDLDQAPLKGNIFFDTNKRADKYGNAFAEALGDGRQAWFNTNFDTTEEISLEDLGTIIHELVHDIHFITAAQRARGNRAMGLDGNPNIWVEGIAVATDKLVTSQGFLDRYLSHLPQFSDPAVRKAIAEADEGLTIYDQMVAMSRARFEINLYQDKNPDGTARSLKERLDFWTEWAKKYLHVEALKGSEGGRVWATPHFAGLPGYYVSYTGGFQTALHAAEDVYAGLLKGDGALLKKGGSKLLHLFDMGARLTNIEEIEREINRLP